MKTYKLPLFASLLLLFFLASCSQPEVVPESSEVAEPQLYTNCNPSSSCINHPYALTGFSTHPMQWWAPYIEDRLNSFHLDKIGGLHTVCNELHSDQVEEISYCWVNSNTYNGAAAQDNLCRLKCWAISNRPAVSYHSNPVGYTEWNITDYSYVEDPNASCLGGSSNLTGLKLSVTYTAYRCDYIVESNHDYDFRKIAVTNGGDIPGTGSIALDFRLYPPDPEGPQPICQEVRIIAPDGSPYQVVHPAGPGADGYQGVEIEMSEYSLSDCIIQLIEAP